MAQYYNNWVSAIPIQRNPFHCWCRKELGLNHYLSTMQWDVTKNTNLVKWWQVRDFLGIFLVTHRHSVEQCNFISYTCMHCLWRPLFSSIICSLQAAIFRQQTNHNWPPGVPRFNIFGRTGNHGVCMETWPLWYGCLDSFSAGGGWALSQVTNQLGPELVKTGFVTARNYKNQSVAVQSSFC